MAEFNVKDITNIRVMRINCARCQEKPAEVPALIYYGDSMVVVDGQPKGMVGIFCQGRVGCDGESWAFPVDPDNSIARKHEALVPLTTDN